MQPVTAKSLVAVSAPVVVWQVYVPVPEVSYPVSVTIVHDCPAARVFAPTVQVPAASLYPREGIVQAGGVPPAWSHAAPEKLLEHVQVVGEDAKTAVARAPLTASHAVQTPVKALVPADW